MHKCLEGTGLRLIHRDNGVSIYHLDAPALLNDYYVTSYEGSRRLLMRPEEVGYQTYLDNLPPTVEALRYFRNHGLGAGKNTAATGTVADGESGTPHDDFANGLDILTILRGGLNYPVEEGCFRAGIRVNNMNFLSCERIIRNKEILGLDIKYQKYNIVNHDTMLIGDIVATGDTLRQCFDYILDKYRKRGAELRRVIFFTVGGTRAFDLMEGFTQKIRSYWPAFEGFTCVFYEGIFSIYQDKGVAGVNVPHIDFYWHDSVLAPEYRQAVLDEDNVLFEKCIIYDGGARRYEIPEHYDEVMEYWRDLRTAADHTSMKAFVDEKIGYPSPADYEQWLKINHYNAQTQPGEGCGGNTAGNGDTATGGINLRLLYEKEEAFRQRSYKRNLRHIAEVRLAEIEKELGDY